ncbi:hypothetical protein BZG36_02741 [Bifiguratus adelaidae]|uniref:DASH complex subunit DAD2 n=1 Tax=Bifiguratus adelaidae TaxID=1938954 RepID=A0A261XYN1_9FUNG|nr:hypothetical protein BZG36_02741 [Bifiguratus adelaidae]
MYSRGSLRQSQRSDTLEGTQHVPANNALLMRLQEKQKEYDNLVQVRDMSKQLVTYFEELAKSMEGLSDGSHAIASVLNNWNHVFRLMSLAHEQAPDQIEGSENGSIAEDNNAGLPTMVKVPVQAADG